MRNCSLFRSPARWLISTLLAVAAAAPAALPGTVDGLWAGGVGSLELEDNLWSFLTLDLETGAPDRRGRAEVTGTLWFGEPQSVTGSLKGERLTLSLQWGGGKATLVGTVDDSMLRGTLRRGSRREDVLLLHETRSGDEVLDARAGAYESDEGLMVIRRSIHLVAHLLGSGEMRVLYDQGPEGMVSGPTLGRPSPAVWHTTFETDEAGEVIGVAIDRGEGGVLLGTRLAPTRSEDFSFRTDDGTVLRGTLYLPAGVGPHPAAVWVHGSGRASRRGAGVYAHLLPHDGMALLAVDKRGVGESDGTYELPDGSHDNEPHMRRRGGDVRAAMAALRERDDIDGARIGLIGASQAGWVIPMAVAGGDVAFSVILSGGTTAYMYENLWSEWSRETETGPDLPAFDELDRRIRGARKYRSAIESELRSYDCPGLWLFGLKDRSNPSALCVELLEQIAAEEETDFSIVTWPDGNHGLMVCRWGGAAEQAALRHSVPGLHATVVTWLQERGFLARASTEALLPDG